MSDSPYVPNGSETIELTFPVTIEGVEVKALTMRRPKVRDMKAMNPKESAIQQEISLYANLCEIPPSAVEALDIADYKKLSKAFTGFSG